MAGVLSQNILTDVPCCKLQVKVQSILGHQRNCSLYTLYWLCSWNVSNFHKLFGYNSSCSTEIPLTSGDSHLERTATSQLFEGYFSDGGKEDVPACSRKPIFWSLCVPTVSSTFFFNVKTLICVFTVLEKGERRIIELLLELIQRHFSFKICVPWMFISITKWK